ncbi:MAG TPA: hypothetical protein DCR05_06550, partial [Alphaproteobacteria bacterium]|nr:hypothetical protein [Alphaproteobacteria bacterium]
MGQAAQRKDEGRRIVIGITLIAVAAGGACGALLRYGAVLATGAGIFGFAGPMATLTVNICGSAMMGLVAGGGGG